MTASPQLVLDAPPYEVAALREVLRRWIVEQPGAFDEMFAPLGPRKNVAVPPEVAHLLRRFGLLQPGGALPMRRKDNRFYAMALGGVGEYRQDVWPETDALLAKLDGAPRGRVLDMGTGCGIVAIEAALRGHAVVATDLYDNTLALARFNAALNGVGSQIEFRQGHLFEPVAGETFDLVLTAPHYTRVADQLRLEALRAAAPLSTPTGRVVVATFCEWEADEPIAMLSTILAEHAQAGFDVAVTPMPQAVKKNWFTVAAPAEPMRGLVSRHRFLVEITRAAQVPGRIDVTMPTADEVLRQRYVRLRALAIGAGSSDMLPRRGVRSPLLAVVQDATDLAKLEQLIAAVRSGVVTLEGDVPTALLDACRWGAKPCVPAEVTLGAAGAFLDREGRVRPCAHGEPLASASTTFGDLVATYARHAAELAERRGCASCSAKAACSRCMFPHVDDEATYCATMRRIADVVPAINRTFAIVAREHLVAPLRIKLRASPTLVAARGRPMHAMQAAPDAERVIANLTALWRATATTIVVDGTGTHALFWVDGKGALRAAPAHPLVAAVGELAGEGASAGEVLAYLHGEGAGGRAGEIIDVFRAMYQA